MYRFRYISTHTIVSEDKRKVSGNVGNDGPNVPDSNRFRVSFGFFRGGFGLIRFLSFKKSSQFSEGKNYGNINDCAYVHFYTNEDKN